MSEGRSAVAGEESMTQRISTEGADLLTLAEGTVKNHVSNLLLKLDARDRTRAALKALQQGHLG